MSPGLDKKQGGNEQCGVGLLSSSERSKTLHSHSENDRSSQRARQDNGKFHWYFRANFGNITRTSIIKMSSPAPQNTWLWTFDRGDKSDSEPIQMNGFWSVKEWFTDSWWGNIKSAKEGLVLVTVTWTLNGPSGWTDQIERRFGEPEISPHEKNCVFARGQKSQYSSALHHMDF